MKKGQLDSISIVPNMSCFDECMELLYASIPSLPFLPKMSVHLDFVEGRSLAGAEQTPLLTEGENGLMGLSWGGVFLLSYLPWKRRVAKEQLKREIRAQIEKVQKAVKHAVELAKEHGIACAQRGVRVDSHQHAHMIPVVWEALTEVIAEERYEVEYIRNSKEMMAAFLLEVSLWKTYRPINFVKNRLLSVYSYRAKKAEQDGRTLEILFHPGLTLSEEVSEEIGEEAAADFYLRDDRHVEMEAVGRMRTLT